MKCNKCGSELKWLFTSTYCPKCDAEDAVEIKQQDTVTNEFNFEAKTAHYNYFCYMGDDSNPYKIDLSNIPIYEGDFSLLWLTC